MKKNPLNKRLKRELFSNKGRYIAISAMLIVTILLFSGMLAITDAVKSTLADSRENDLVEDGQFESLLEMDQDTISDVEDIGIKIYENYYYNFLNIENENDKELEDTTVRIYKERKSNNNVNVEEFFEGEEPKGKNEIALDRLFLESNNIKVGDYIKIDSKKYKVSGSIALPDYTSLFEKNSNLIMDARHFGVGIVSKEAFDEFDIKDVIYNYCYRFNNRDIDNKIDFNNDIKNKLVENKVMLTSFLSKENNQCISFVDDDLGSDVPMVRNFCLVIIGIMAFVFAIVILSTIDEESKIIGTLLSLGYKKWEIVFHYLKMPFYVSIFSAIVGNALGYTAMANVFKDIYYKSYSLAPCKGVALNAEALILSTIVPIIIMVVINMIMLRYKMTITPLRFLRKYLKKNKSKRGIKLPNFKFFNRFRIRVILQNKANYLMLLVGIILGNVILLFGLCIDPTFAKYIDDIKDTSISEYQYVLKNPVELEDEDAEKYVIESMETENKSAGKDMDISLYGIEKNSKYLTSINLTTADKGVYVSTGLLKKKNMKIGDYITLVDKSTNKEYDLKIEGTIDYASGLSVFMNIKSLNTLLSNDEDYFNGYFSNEELDIDKDNVYTKITVNDLAKLGDQMLSSFAETSKILLVVAVLIFISLMYILTKIVIDKNSMSISYMKVFGYNSKEINKLYLRATTIVVIISIIVSLPLSYYILRYIFAASMAKISGYIDIYVGVKEYLIMAFMGFVSYLLINLLHIRRISNITMAEALKDRE